MSTRAVQVEAFMADLARLSETQPDLFEAGDVGIFPAQKKFGVLPENQCDLDLDVLATNTPGAGWGRTVMQILTALADRHGLDIYVKAKADDEDEHPDSIQQGDLEAFYARFDFVDVGNWSVRDMVRRARPQTPENEAVLTKTLSGERLWTPLSQARPR